LGTCLGISTSYLAAALKLNLAGSVVTLEGAETKARLAAQNFRELGLSNVCTIVGRFQDTLDDVLEPIKFAFIDGHHEESATLAYFE
jgi:predicted O-methyltransferase YrrM